MFDTDGYIGYKSQRIEIMLGRFSDKCTSLVSGIKLGLESLNINSSVYHSKDGRLLVRLTEQVAINAFLSKIGTSNIKHIVRFLLWRLARYEAKIELEGLKKLMYLTNLHTNLKIREVSLPFLWNLNNNYFLNYIKDDLDEINGAQIRKLYKWTKVTRTLIKLIGNKFLAKRFHITGRSLRRWREGTRFPSYKYITELTKIANENHLNLDDYKVEPMAKTTVDALISGGKATASPPLGPAF